MKIQIKRISENLNMFLNLCFGLEIKQSGGFKTGITEFECVAICNFLFDEKFLSRELQNGHYQQTEELSKMLFAMIKNPESKNSLALLDIQRDRQKNSKSSLTLKLAPSFSKKSTSLSLVLPNARSFSTL